MSKSKTAGGAARQTRQAPSRRASSGEKPAGHGSATRETVESIAVAVILAFLFRAFVAEAFVIPTGSMAPTLMGQHKDVECEECGYWYQAGASIENDEDANAQRTLESGRARRSERGVVATTCPLCRYRQVLDLYGDANQSTFSGDRILVSKFIYDFTSPKRWDVIVFKFPFNAKQNFIKRLIGLPGETVLIKRGDIFIKGPDQEDFRIARKPDRKLKAMLQLVDDTKYIARSLSEIGWPIRWQSWSERGTDIAELWSSEDGGHSFDTQGVSGRDIWLRYHHIVPSPDDWQWIEDGEQPPMMDQRTGELISDFYAYNAFTSVERYYLDPKRFDPDVEPESYTNPMFGSASLHPFATLGLHWVGDLAMEGDLVVKSGQGELLLQLVKGGVAYHCRIDVASGKATLSIGNGQGEFVAEDGTVARSPVGQTKVQGQGTYSIRYSNVDAEIRLWVNEKRVEFDGPTTYAPRDDAGPETSSEDPGDLAPAGIGSQGCVLHVERLRVFRDVYYVASKGGHEYQWPYNYGAEEILEVFQDPTQWSETTLFKSRGTLEFHLEPDQFFPMGDNSPQSSDARMWQENYFARDLLIGRALLIYWPHPWYRPIPYLPNVGRMRLIH